MTVDTSVPEPADLVAANTRRLRKLRGLSQSELAKRARLDRPDVSRIENARCPVLGTDRLRRLAEALGVEIADLFARTS